MPRTTPFDAEVWKRIETKALENCAKLDSHVDCVIHPNDVERVKNALPCIELATRFEPPLFARQIGLEMGAVDASLRRVWPDAPKIRFGSLPTGTFDAQALRPPQSNDFLIILNRDIFRFTSAFSTAVSDSIPISYKDVVELDGSEDSIRKRLKERPHIVNNFADAMVDLVRSGSPRGTSEAALDRDHNRLNVTLGNAMLTFIISHEAAHVMLGHTSNQTSPLHLAAEAGPIRNQKGSGQLPQKSVRAPDGSALEQVHRTRDQEIEADAFGLKLLILVEGDGHDPPLEFMISAAAPEIVFRILDAANIYG